MSDSYSNLAEQHNRERVLIFAGRVVIAALLIIPVCWLVWWVMLYGPIICVMQVLRNIFGG